MAPSHHGLLMAILSRMARTTHLYLLRSWWVDIAVIYLFFFRREGYQHKDDEHRELKGKKILHYTGTYRQYYPSHAFRLLLRLGW